MFDAMIKYVGNFKIQRHDNQNGFEVQSIIEAKCNKACHLNLINLDVTT